MHAGQESPRMSTQKLELIAAGFFELSCSLNSKVVTRIHIHIHLYTHVRTHGLMDGTGRYYILRLAYRGGVNNSDDTMRAVTD